jgi:hypothetical protein
MIGFMDKTWCNSPHCKNACGRQFTSADRERAIRWWGGEDFPIFVKEYCDEEGNLKDD